MLILTVDLLFKLAPRVLPLVLVLRPKLRPLLVLPLLPGSYRNREFVTRQHNPDSIWLFFCFDKSLGPNPSCVARYLVCSMPCSTTFLVPYPIQRISFGSIVYPGRRFPVVIHFAYHLCCCRGGSRRLGRTFISHPDQLV
jgi:hypothetical protein